MSITGNLNIFPFSLTGLQNIDGTINGQIPVNEITITGQTTYLSSTVIPDVNGDVNLDLHIPNGTSTDVGLNYDLTQTNNVWAGTQDFTNPNLKMSLNPADTGFHIGYDPTTRALTYNQDGSSNVLDSNNVWNGSNYFTKDTSFNGICDMSSINFGHYPNGEISIKCQDIPRIFTEASGGEIIIDGVFSLPSIPQINFPQTLYYDVANGGMITYDDLSFGQILNGSNVWYGTQTFQNKVFLNNDVSMNGGGNLYVKADGASATGSPKLRIDLANYNSYYTDTSLLTYLVQSQTITPADDKVFEISAFQNRTYQRVPVDIVDANYSFSLSLNIQGLCGGYVYSSVNLTADRTLFLPNADQFGSMFGSYYSCSFSVFTVPSLPWNILIDRLTPDTPSTVANFYVNGSLQVSFPFNLGSNNLWTCNIEKYPYSGVEYITYYFRAG